MQIIHRSLKTYSGATSTLLQSQYKHNLNRKQQILFANITQVTQRTFSGATSFLLLQNIIFNSNHLCYHPEKKLKFGTCWHRHLLSKTNY